jgi:hypothetical protein
MPSGHRSYWVYVLGSLSGTLYIGTTGDLHRRVFENNFIASVVLLTSIMLNGCFIGNRSIGSRRQSTAKSN